MYCRFQGCNSSCKKIPRKIRFFSLPKITNKANEKNKIWVNFCKRKGFVPFKYSGMCSLHFSEDAYVTSHSPHFLSTLNFQKKQQKLHVKPEAEPTKNKPLDMFKDAHSDCRQAKRHIGALARGK